MIATTRVTVRNQRSRRSGARRGVRASSLALLSVAAIAALLTIWPETSWASRTMRCGNSLIGKGAFEDQVLARCGAPYSTRGNYWLYRVRNVVFRLYFRDGRVSWVKSEIVY